MILVWLILIPFIGGLLSWLVSRWCVPTSRWVALAAMVAQLILALNFTIFRMIAGLLPVDEFAVPWIPQIGVTFHLATDGVSMLLILLTGFIGILSVAASWEPVKERVGYFHFVLLWSLAAITGVFLARDLFLFYFFWEMMIIPLYLLIDIWGNENRHYAAVKFFLFTQIGGLFLLVAILALFYLHGNATGSYTFDYAKLLNTEMSPVAAMLLLLGFLVSFAVKLPAVPVHTWLPDAHTQAPVAGSVVLAGLVLKVGAYGILRFVLPLFPGAAQDFAPIAMLLGVFGILYGASLAFSQTDLKRLVAYTSISHMGFVLLGIFAWNGLSLQGAMLILIAHGVSTGALFIMAGIVAERLETRDMRKMGGLWTKFPRMGGFALFLALAMLGLPGMATFAGEFLVLLGTFREYPVFAILGSLGLILSVVYSLWMIQRVFFGQQTNDIPVAHDLNAREMAMMLAAAAVIIWLGLYPQPVINTAERALQELQQPRGLPKAIILPSPNSPRKEAPLPGPADNGGAP
ncbi:MAG: complex I subunit 4 family protein [Armatimonadota bacterium]